jgi:hypothetical protein
VPDGPTELAAQLPFVKYKPRQVFGSAGDRWNQINPICAPEAASALTQRRRRTAGRRALIWPGLSRRQRSYRQGFHGRMAWVARIFIQITLCRERSLMPRGARSRGGAGSVSLWRRGMWLAGTPGATGQVDADVEVEVLDEQVLELAASDDGQPVVPGCEDLRFWADPCGGDEDSGCSAFSSTEPASARTSLAGTQLLYRLAWISISDRCTMSVLL